MYTTYITCHWSLNIVPKVRVVWSSTAESDDAMAVYALPCYVEICLHYPILGCIDFLV